MLPAFWDNSDKVFAVTDDTGIESSDNSLDVIEPTCNLDPEIELINLDNDFTSVIEPIHEEVHLDEPNIDKLENFDLHTNNKYKDTIEYMFIMCSKTEMIRKAIEESERLAN